MSWIKIDVLLVIYLSRFLIATPMLGSWVDRRRNRRKGEMGRSSGARAYVKIDRHIDR